MSNEHDEMMGSAEPTSKQALNEMRIQTEQNEIMIRLLGRLCEYEEEKQESDKHYKADWYAKHEKESKIGKWTLFFSAIAVLIGIAAIGVELLSRLGLLAGVLTALGFM